MSRLIEFDLKNDIFAHYQKLDLAFYKKNKTGDLMARISEDVGQVRMYVGPAIMYAISTFSLFILIMVRMLSINVELTIYVLVPLPILAVAIYLLNSKIIRKSEAVQKQLSTISSFVQEMFSGIRVLKAYNREDFTALMDSHFGIPKQTTTEFFDTARSMNFYDDQSMSTRELFNKFFPGREDIVRLLMEPITYANGSTLEDPAITYGIVFSNFIAHHSLIDIIVKWVSHHFLK